MIPFIVSGNTLSAYVGAQLQTIDSSHPYFEEIKDRLMRGESVDTLFDVAAALREEILYRDDTIQVGWDCLLYKGQPVHNYLALKIIEMARNHQPIEPWVNFLKQLQNNPDQEIKEHLFEWMEQAGMPITPDGHFLAYKKVKDDYTSFHDSTTRNDVGSSIFLPRNECDPDRFRTCSSGLHFCSFSYLNSYYGSAGRVVVLKINPADVVAFPTDHSAKGRACRYMIVDEVPYEKVEWAFPEPVYETAYDDWDDWDDWDDGLHFPDDDYRKEDVYPGIFGRVKAWLKRRTH